MRKQTKFKINPRREVENQVDAMFAPLYSLIPERHHKAITQCELDMITAIKDAMRMPATEPEAPDPIGWPWSSSVRLAVFLTPAQRRELRAAREKPSKK